MNTSNNPPQIIGLAGMFASGKDTLANYLADHYSYRHISTGDILRDEAMKRYGSTERPVLFKTGTELRREAGAGVLVQRAIHLFEQEQADRHFAGAVISGLRSLGEAKAILQAGGVLLFVDAPIEIRYQRMQSRLRDNETHLTLAEFKAQEEKELRTAGDDDAAFNLLGIRELAGKNLLSNGEDLQSFLDEALGLLNLPKHT